MNTVMGDDLQSTPASCPSVKKDVGKMPIGNMTKIAGNMAKNSTQFNAEARLTWKDNRKVIESQITKYAPCVSLANIDPL
jgi:hypothetical protein